MPVLMVRPTRHPKSGVFRLRMAIPPGLAETAERLYGVRRELTVTLGTKDPAEAKRLAPRFLDDLERKMAAIRAAADSPPRVLTHMQVHAIAGAYYRERMVAAEADPGSYERWDRERDALLDLLPVDNRDGTKGDFQPTAMDLTEAESVLSGRSIVTDTSSVYTTAQALWLAKVQLAETMMRRASGDYGRDAHLERFPDLSVVTAAAPAPTPKDHPAASQRASTGTPSASSGPTFDDLLNGWARDQGHDPDAEPVHRAVYDRRRTLARFAEFAGHSDAARITRADAIAWKEAMVSRSLKPATIRNDLSEVSAIWKWAVRHAKAADNPFTGLLPPKPTRRTADSRREFTDEEATRILVAARGESGALRWMPWVLAATGARLSEISQCMKADVQSLGGVAFIRIHDDPDEREEGEAQRSVKTAGSVRNVPVHPQLVAEGFLEYVARLPKGSALFPDVKPDGLFGNRGTNAQKLLSRWMRTKVGITDPRLAPAHSWRHWFIAKARAARIQAEMRNALTGHADGGNESHRYGTGWREMPEVLAEEIAKIKLPASVRLEGP